ncbi:hypothetical protein D3C77_682510 [compost metagenome]
MPVTVPPDVETRSPELIASSSARFFLVAEALTMNSPLLILARLLSEVPVPEPVK